MPLINLLKDYFVEFYEEYKIPRFGNLASCIYRSEEIKKGYPRVEVYGNYFTSDDLDRKIILLH